MALLGTLVNKFGKTAEWSSVKVVMLGCQVEGITALSYKDNKEKDSIYGVSEFPAGRGEGNYKAEASTTLLKEEANALQLTLNSGKRLTGIELFDILVMHEYKGLVVRDVIWNVKFTDDSMDVRQGDKSIATQFTLLPSHIDWNVVM